MEWWETFKDWFLSLGENYGVNPYVFGGIYLAAIPFFFLSLGWTIKNIRQKKSVVLPALLTGLFFISAYLYLIIAGENIPTWVYVFIGLMVVYGVYSTVKKDKSKDSEGGGVNFYFSAAPTPTVPCMIVDLHRYSL